LKGEYIHVNRYIKISIWYFIYLEKNLDRQGQQIESISNMMSVDFRYCDRLKLICFSLKDEERRKKIEILSISDSKKKEYDY
jgi:hypothetical protein